MHPPVVLRFEVRGPRGPVRGARLFWFDRADRRLLVETDKKGRRPLEGRVAISDIAVSETWMDGRRVFGG